MDTAEDQPIGVVEMTVTAFRCRCGHEWRPKQLAQWEKPRVCPKCKSANWDRAYKYHRKKGVEQGE